MSGALIDLLLFALIIVFILGFVSIVMWFKKKEDERRTQVLLAALEKGVAIDSALFRPKTDNRLVVKYILLALLVIGSCLTIIGGFFLALGIAYSINNQKFDAEMFVPFVLLVSVGVSLLLGYFKAKKMLKSELEDKE